MGMYAIKDTTLTALGDAVRLKKDGLKVAPYVHKVEALVYKSGTSTENLTLATDEMDDLSGKLTPWIKVRVNSITNWQENGWSISHSSNSGTITIPYGTTFPMEFYCRYSFVSFKGYHTPSSDNPNLPLPVLDVEIWGCNEDKEPYFYTPLEMAEKISEFKVPVIEPIVLTGDCTYMCAGPMASSFILNFGDKVSTNKVASMNNMFKGYKNSTIPFEINVDNSTYRDMNYTFVDNNNLIELPKINNAYPTNISNFCDGCYCIRTIPEDYCDSWNFNRLHTYNYGNLSYMFRKCYSLRKIPPKILNELWNIATGASYSLYTYGFANCYTLDEIVGLAVSAGSLSSNCFATAFQNCYRLKDMIFQTNEDGTPIIAKWKSQTIDLTSYVGYSYSASAMINFNSGITADKEVKDDATYQALKNDPDWWSLNINYSRYNHDSAVNTINSLPDCSATGTNIIKFQGTSGAKTDGGAINTLTAEEIAIATAKGWTVTML